MHAFGYLEEYDWVFLKVEENYLNYVFLKIKPVTDIAFMSYTLSYELYVHNYLHCLLMKGFCNTYNSNIILCSDARSSHLLFVWS